MADVARILNGAAVPRLIWSDETVKKDNGPSETNTPDRHIDRVLGNG
jgi:hypothetical protein